MSPDRYGVSTDGDRTTYRLSRTYEEPKHLPHHSPPSTPQTPRHRLSQQHSGNSEEARTLLGAGHTRDSSSASTLYQNNRGSMLSFEHSRHSSLQTIDTLASQTSSTTKKRSVRLGERFFRRGRKKVGVVASLKVIILHSWLNFFIIFIPISWIAHFYNAKQHHGHHVGFDFPYPLTFLFSLLAIMPLQKFFDFGGEQMSFYVGKDLGDLVVVTLNNAVEATLAIILLIKCEIKLLQATIIGVILLHLLLVPGTAFIIDGARLLHQDLHPHLTQLNHTLLIMGVLSLLLPGAFFSVIDRPDTETHGIDDNIRHSFLTMSHGLAIILLVVYICSRFYLHNPPGEEEIEVPVSLRDEEEYLLHAEPLLNQYVCMAMLIIALGLMATTAVWLVDSVEVVGIEGHIPEEWFGLILLPFVSFSADGALALGYFVRYVIESLRGREKPPATLARAQAIDLSIQFILFWMPLLVLLGWAAGRPLPLLFDFFQIAIVFGSCFLVNYVTQDAKTNWAEGVAMVAFYAMIVLSAWFYRGPRDIAEILKFGICANVEEHGAVAGGSGGH